MVTVVVCDDDAFLRQNVSELCEAAGLTVVAETDRGHDALELVKRFDVDVLLLDLAMPDGSGERTLEALRDVDPHPVVVVLTAYAEDPDRLVRLGAREVIEKPDFGRLEVVLAQLAAAGSRRVEDDATGAERRQTSRPVAALDGIWRSPSGVASARDLPSTLALSAEGDAVLVVVSQGLETLEQDVGATLATDCRLRAAALLRATLRVQDVVHEVPEVRGFAALLRGGDASAAEAAWKRLVTLLDGAGVPGHVVGAQCRVDAEGGFAALGRALAAVRSAGAGAQVLVSA